MLTKGYSGQNIRKKLHVELKKRVAQSSKMKAKSNYGLDKLKVQNG